MRRCATTLEGEMSAAEHALLLSLLREAGLSGPHLEVGTAAGGTLCAMMGCYRDDARPPFVVVDRMTYFPNQLETVQHNLQMHGFDPGQVEFRVSTSAAAFQQAARRHDTFDFILLDGSHKMLAVMGDLRWSRLLRVGGVIALHDYGARFPGVKRSVDHFIVRNPHFGVVGQADTLIALRRESVGRRPEVSSFDRAYALAGHAQLLAKRQWDKWRSPGRVA